MKLTELYKLRHNFTVIGLTGRTGSGCTEIAELLTKNFPEISNGIRNPNEIEDEIGRKKFEICYNFLNYDNNWKPFEIIKYKNIILFYFISFFGEDKNSIEKTLLKYYKENEEDNNFEVAKNVAEKIFTITDNSITAKKIIKYKGNFKNIKNSRELKKLHNLFFDNNFNILSNKIWKILEENGYYRRTKLLHHISYNIRLSGNPLNEKKINDINFIYTLAELTNRLIKAKKYNNDFYRNGKPTKIIIDSLRNSLEIMFFKERYSAFYMIAAKDGNNKNRERVLKRFIQYKEPEKEILTDKLLHLDSIEYKTGDHSKGDFSSPDIYNCIQKSDFHIITNKLEDLLNKKSVFFTIEEQLMKFISLVQQPGIITPSSSERCMQTAYNVKLNSGCISRQVGAVVTDINYSIKSVGWNDVPQGQTPCNLRNANDYFSEQELSDIHYSKFERGKGLNNIDVDFKYKNKEPKNFPQAIKDYYNGKDLSLNNEDLEGKNCSFCFKSIHNHYEKEKNQVHTKSLHAEENAMLQISKYGGQALSGGILFTTASPCELCSKKAVQLGINKVYYIDPYPGISEPHILNYNRINKMELIPFNGAIGKAYNKLYEPFMAYKDEVQIMLENNPKTYKDPKWNEIIEEFDNIELKNKLKEFLLDKKFNENKLLEQLLK